MMDLVREALILLALLLTWHFLADFPLQGEYLAKWKDGFNDRNSYDNIPTNLIMYGHCLVHAVGVGVVILLAGTYTGFVYHGYISTINLPYAAILCAGLEMVAHLVADISKCAGKITLKQDQYFHVACKVIWSALTVFYFHAL